MTLGATFERGQARVLFEGVPFFSGELHFQPSPDGQRFLALLEDESGPQAAAITVVTNWPLTLRK